MTDLLLIGIAVAVALGVVADILKAKHGMIPVVILSGVVIAAAVTAYALGLTGIITTIISMMVFASTRQVTDLFFKPKERVTA